MVTASKVPMIKPGEFELWRIRIEQYIQMTDYALWEVIENGNTAPKTTVVEGLKLNSIKDAKLLMEAVKKRFGGNAVTKNTQRNLLKQQYENFTTPSSEMLDQTFDRHQKLVSQLELLGEMISQEDVNQKLLRSLSPDWNIHVVVWRNKADLDTMSMDDLYNNLKSSKNQDYKNKESIRRTIPVETSTSTALVSCDGLGGYDWSDQAEDITPCVFKSLTTSINPQCTFCNVHVYVKTNSRRNIHTSSPRPHRRQVLHREP
ncbi:hypothetical protein Tco_0836062 [Tanacetum coccineum]